MKPETKSLQESLKMVNGGLGHNRPSPQPLPAVFDECGNSSAELGESTEPDLEFSCEGNDHPLVPPGDYEVTFVKAEKMRQWNSTKVFLWFRIQSFGEWHGLSLLLPCNLKDVGKVSTRSQYYRNWVVAAGRKPDRFDRKRMTTRIFKGKVFLARVVTVKKDQKRLPLPPELHYSKIEGLLNSLTG
jgi:hypothetical protein